MSAQLEQPAPEMAITEWVQGEPTSLAQLRGQVVILEVFQVNCPGCFLYGLPDAIHLYQTFTGQPVQVLGIATAFEDFDQNNRENLRILLEDGEVVGETRRLLEKHDQLREARLPYGIPFPVALDELLPGNTGSGEEEVHQFVERQVPDFHTLPDGYRQRTLENVRQYLASRHYAPQTFDTYNLRGTPSTIVIDQEGILKEVTFGQAGHVELLIRRLLNQ